jgi:hypothetical protein
MGQYDPRASEIGSSSLWLLVSYGKLKRNLAGSLGKMRGCGEPQVSMSHLAHRQHLDA